MYLQPIAITVHASMCVGVGVGMGVGVWVWVWVRCHHLPAKKSASEADAYTFESYVRSRHSPLGVCTQKRTVMHHTAYAS